jgi:hypothetical protein
VFFKPRVGAIENAYLDAFGNLVMFREASLPDVCIVCGTPARGNLYQAEFEPHRNSSWNAFTFYYVTSRITGNRYFVNFPFCSICKPENFDIHASRIDEEVGFFGGVSNTFLKLLPRLPLELAAELEGTWAQRAWRAFMR